MCIHTVSLSLSLYIYIYMFYMYICIRPRRNKCPAVRAAGAAGSGNESNGDSGRNIGCDRSNDIGGRGSSPGTGTHDGN